MDENNSDILKQKKKIDKLDNDNKIIDPERYWAPPKLYCEVVVIVVVVEKVIPALQEKP